MFHHSDQFDFFVFAMMHRVREPLCEPNSFCSFVLRITSGPRVKFVDSKSVLNPRVVYATDRSKAVVPVLFLLLDALLVILRGASCLVLPCSLFSCLFVVVFQTF